MSAVARSTAGSGGVVSGVELAHVLANARIDTSAARRACRALSALIACMGSTLPSRETVIGASTVQT
jgi:hypothetical protein